MKIEIKSNVFYIPERLKEIDRGYFILYNTDSGKFEVHNKENIGNTYCLTVPYNELDARTIEMVKQTRIENADRLIAEMDKENEKILERKYKQMQDTREQISKDVWQTMQKPIYSYNRG